MESKVERNNYILLQGWMLTDLGLKGNELIIYACIYGFSQTENQVFSGSLRYLADWTNSTRQGVQKSLKSLIEKGYIAKTDKTINGVKFCEYRVEKYIHLYNSVAQGVKQSCTGGVQLSCTNNIDIDNLEDKLDNNISITPQTKPVRSPRRRPRTVKPEQFDRFWDVYPRKVNKRDAQKAWAALNPTDELVEQIIEDVKERIRIDWASKQKCYIPHPATYIRGARWEDEHTPETSESTYQKKYPTRFEPQPNFVDE